MDLEALKQVNPALASMVANAQRTAVARPAAPAAAPGAAGMPSTIAAGAVGPGGAKFGGGAGGPNRFDYTQYGGGLWSIGIDPNAPDVDSRVQQWFNSQPSNVQAEVRKGMKGGKSLTWAADWRQRDVARKIQKEHGMFDFLGPLAPVGQIAATVGGAALGNMLLPGIGAKIGGTLAGGITGGLQSKNVLGGVLGAAGGYGLGSAVGAAGGVGNLAKNTVTSIKNGFNSLTGKFQPNALAGNAVPGIRTGVTTPAGGAAINGSGQAAKLTGLAGGAPLGASPLAVAGGAAASSIFPRFPQLGTVQGLQPGRISGTNINVGSKTPTGPLQNNILKTVADNLPAFGGGTTLDAVQDPSGVFTVANTQPLATNSGGAGGAVGALAAGGAGATPAFYNELSRALGEQPGILHKTRPGAYFNALSNLQPMGASYA